MRPPDASLVLVTIKREEYRVLLDQCDPWMRAVVVVAANTGMRRSEILRLRWPDIDFEARRIAVLKTKTDRPRQIPMNEEVAGALEGMPRHIDTDLVFHQHGGLIQGFTKRWNAARERAGLRDVHFHDLRHTFSTWLSELGVSPMVIMALTGHTTANMLKRYTNISDPAMAAAVGALAGKVGMKVGTKRGSKTAPNEPVRNSRGGKKLQSGGRDLNPRLRLNCPVATCRSSLLPAAS